MTKQDIQIALGTIATLIFGLCLGAAILAGIYQLSPEDPPITELRVATVIVEREVEVEKPVMVEKIITATPAPASVQAPVLPPTQEAAPCEDKAWVEMQPKNDLLGRALKVGTINRLMFVIDNVGTCTWDGYKLVSIGDAFPDIDIPYTEPGQQAIFNAPDFIVRWPLELRFVIQPPTSTGIFGFANGNPLDNTIYYRMDTYSPRSNAIQMDSVASYGYGCGANG